jgi:hypothetical protein
MGEQRLGSRVSWGGGQNRWQGIDRTAAWTCSLDERREKKEEGFDPGFQGTKRIFFTYERLYPVF